MEENFMIYKRKCLKNNNAGIFSLKVKVILLQQS